MNQSPVSQTAEFFDRCARAGLFADFDDNEGARVRELMQMWNIAPGQRVLEPGCGCGRLTSLLAEAVGPTGHVLACDVSGEMVGRARARGLPDSVLLVSGALESLGAAAGPFDHVICFNVFPHFSNHPEAVRAMARLLRPGGQLWICHSQGRQSLNDFHRTAAPEVAHHVLPPDAAMETMVSEADMVVERIEDDRVYLLAARKR